MIPLFLGLVPAGARLQAWLLYPGTGEKKAREEAVSAFIFEAMRLAAMQNPEGKPIRVPRPSLLQGEAERSRILGKADVRLRKRLAAARMTWRLLLQAIRVRQEGGRATLTLDALSRQYYAEAGEMDPGNLQSRVFRPTFRVLHLTLALAIVLTYGKKATSAPTKEEVRRMVLTDADLPEGGSKEWRYDFLLSPSFVPGLLKMSDEIARQIELVPQLRRAASQLIRFDTVVQKSGAFLNIRRGAVCPNLRGCPRSSPSRPLVRVRPRPPR